MSLILCDEMEVPNRKVNRDVVVMEDVENANMDTLRIPTMKMISFKEEEIILDRILEEEIL